MDLRYDDAIPELFRCLPEADEAYRLWDINGEPLPYIVFSFLEESFFTPAFLSPDSNTALVSRIFGFLEAMASSSNGEVVNLLWVGLFEAWAADVEKFRLAFAHMGPRTKALAQKAAKEFQLPKL